MKKVVLLINVIAIACGCYIIDESFRMGLFCIIINTIAAFHNLFSKD